MKVAWLSLCRPVVSRNRSHFHPVATEGMDPASFSWDVYSRPPANTVILRKAVSLMLRSLAGTAPAQSFELCPEHLALQVAFGVCGALHAKGGTGKTKTTTSA